METDQLAFTWRGRVALYAILKAIGVGPGDEVVLPAFTCIAVPNVVLYLGATPVYCDIDPETYTPTAATISPRLTDRTRVVLAQNTFGLSADLNPILRLTSRHGIHVVEDCAHGLGGTYRGRPNGTLADASFFSTQWSKPVSTGLGGFAYSPNRALAEKIQQVVADMPQPGWRSCLSLACQRRIRPIADDPRLHYPMIALYRRLTQHLGLLPGSSGTHELVGTKMPPGFCQQMSRWQRRWLAEGMKELPSMIQNRRATAMRYDIAFGARGIGIPYRPDYAMHAMLRYAIRVGNKTEVIQFARQQRIPIGDWFSTPLHPYAGDTTAWNYRAGQCPAAERACQQLVNLYTDRPLSDDKLDRLTQIIRPARRTFGSHSLEIAKAA